MLTELKLIQTLSPKERADTATFSLISNTTELLRKKEGNIEYRTRNVERRS